VGGIVAGAEYRYRADDLGWGDGFPFRVILPCAIFVSRTKMSEIACSCCKIAITPTTALPFSVSEIA
jgi:hypothetical protein